MWLICSSIGRKLVMSISGTALMLFLLFHGAMNLVSVISPEGYNTICGILGANWYALVATAGLAFLVAVHFVYALVLSIQNYLSRGFKRYSVKDAPKDVSWQSRNMLLLGAIIIGFLLLHLYNFWFKMQFAELTGIHTGAFDPHDGAAYVQALFANPVYGGLYLIWLVALWLHLTHGIWSALQSMGLNNTVWMQRIKCISKIVATFIVLMFAVVVVYYTWLAYYTNSFAFNW
ncbi:MAG: succinate dehydrogenase cytochrome b subunit [Prevotellaceae bacterium]|jgi:succinate dehydrogenase / fumarate reductase cytochrome b subunit|nr:succinate dehydrogenase cytochrome b subunit [Prevotellaceae bacterium]